MAIKTIDLGCVIGPQGPQGPAGAAGAKGATGATGAKGDPGLFYGTCATAAATKAKAVSLSGFSLVTGAVVAVKFTYANTAASPTLNVNSTGAKSIAVYGSTAAGSGAWSAGEVVVFAYDGTRWVMASGATVGTRLGCEIYTGSYTGTGESSNTTSFTLNFPKIPVFLIIQREQDVSYYSNAVRSGASIAGYSGTAKMTVSGTALTFTGKSSAVNSNSTVYHYIAFARADGAGLPAKA